MRKLGELLAPAFIPFLFALIFSAFLLVYKALNLPSPSDIMQICQKLYSRYGLWVLLFSAFVEGIFMINAYFPGSLVIIVAVFLAPKTIEALAIIGMVTWVGFLLAAFVNYPLGAFGFYRTLLWLGKREVVEGMQRWMDKKGGLAIIWTAIHPNFLAISQVCMGIARENIGRMVLYSCAGLAIWIPVWTIFFALFARQVNLEDRNQAWYIVGALVCWGLVLVIRKEWQRRRETLHIQ